MADIIGFDNTQKKEHHLTNTLDGSLNLRIYSSQAAGETIVYINGSEVCRSDAGEEKAPYYCGSISIPRGEFTLRIESGCDVANILLGEDVTIETEEQFSLMYMNRKFDEIFQKAPVNYSPEIIDELRRHGFIYDHPHDTEFGAMPSGVPLGGMGCGKLEITEDGLFTAFTGNNNQDCPIYRMPGSFMALGCGEDVRILRKDTLDLPYNTLSASSADLEFPFAKLNFDDENMPVAVSMEAFSSHIPGNAADSSIPCVFFDVVLHNKKDSETDAMFCFSWENIINVGGNMMALNKGERLFPLCYHTWNCSYPWSDRRKNHCVRDGSCLIFSADDDRGNPSSYGKHIVWCSEKDAVSVENRSILPEDEKSFIDILRGKNTNLAESDSEFRAGAWIVRRKLTANGEARLRFALLWYMPSLLDMDGNDFGVEYTNRFNDVKDVLDYALANRDRLYKETENFNNIINRSTLPTWFKRRLLDDRFVVNTCSWYDKYGNFSINEAPTGMAGCLGTLDQRTASQVYYTSFFPELDERELDLFRRSQAEDGMCAHEIGFGTIKLVARPFSKWPDLADAYIIQVYHHYQRTGNIEFLNLHWPHIKKAIDWTLTLDDLKCGIPFICHGRGTTYDNQFWEGINAFISTMQLAAYRLAASVANILGKEKEAGEWTALAESAKKYRMEHLWNNEFGYFNNAYNPSTGEIDDSCFISSLAGDWAVIRAGLEADIDSDQINSIAGAIVSQCVCDYGITDQGGRKEETQGFMQYPMAYLASPALYAGNTAAAWRLASVTDKVITQPGISTHFNQGLTYSYNGKRRGLPYYMTAPASWNMLEALAGLKADLGKGELFLAPYEIPGCKIPVFITGCGFELIGSDDGNSLTLSPCYSERENKFKKLTLPGKWHTDKAEAEFDGANTVFAFSFDPGCENIVLHRITE